MVIPRGGQEPICYTEVVALQRTSEEKPRQDGSTSQRAARKKRLHRKRIRSCVHRSKNDQGGLQQPGRKLRQTAGELATGTPAKTRTSKTTTRGSTTKKNRHEHRPGKKTTAATSKSTTSRAKTAKAKIRGGWASRHQLRGDLNSYRTSVKLHKKQSLQYVIYRVQFNNYLDSSAFGGFHGICHYTHSWRWYRSRDY